jgi:hypothetical protein
MPLTSMRENGSSHNNAVRQAGMPAWPRPAAAPSWLANLSLPCHCAKLARQLGPTNLPSRLHADRMRSPSPMWSIYPDQVPMQPNNRHVRTALPSVHGRWHNTIRLLRVHATTAWLPLRSPALIAQPVNRLNQLG